MANTPKKVKDPTEVALSAIQEALNISDATADTSRTQSPRAETDADVLPPESMDFGQPSFDDRPVGNNRPVFDTIEEPRAPRRAANDDRETIGQLLQALQKGRPARNIYTFATIFAGIWL